MRILRRMRLMTTSLLRRDRFENNMAAEIRFHLEAYTEDLVRSGVPRGEARRRAQTEFGSMECLKEECRDSQPLEWLGGLARDIRLGFRSLRRDKVFALSVTIILALGIGTSVTMFSVLRAVVLRPLPYERPGELVRLDTQLIAQNRPDGSNLANVYDWRRQSRSFAAITFYRRTAASTVTFVGAEAPERAQEGLVGPEFFQVLGTPPLIGRTFSKDEFEHAERVVVLSEGLWREQFAGSVGVLGRKLSIDGADHVILGVMPRTFQLPTGETRFWRPFSLWPQWSGAQSVRDGDFIEVLGHLRPDVRIEDARAEMSVIAARLRTEHAVNKNLDVRVLPLFEHVVGRQTQRGMWLAFAAVLCLLVIACANAGGLLFARAARKRRELAVRTALGAGRLRLIRQLLAEGISLWALASVAGVLLAYALIRLLLAYGPQTLPRMNEAGLDMPALAVAFAGGLAVVMICNVIPALMASKTDASQFAIRDQAGLPGRRWQDWLVASQIAGALVLLNGALLFAQSFIHALAEDPGYPAENMLIVHVELPRTSYPDRAALERFYREADEKLLQVPGVAAVGGITDFFIRRNADQWVTVEGRPAGKAEGAPKLAIEGVTPGYFTAMGIDLLEGRDFEDRDLAEGNAGVFIVSESLAHTFWPGESAIGKRMVSGESAPANGRWQTVVGVVRDIRREGRDIPPILTAFAPAVLRNRDMTIRVSTTVDSMIPAVRQAIRSVDGSLALSLMNANSRLSGRLDARRFESQSLGAFAAIALLLSAAGLYALLAYQVELRTREIGIRSALGADRRAIIRMILEKGLRLALTGSVAGIALTLAVSRILESFLYKTAAINPTGYVAVAGFVLLVAAIAAFVPSLRAASVNPISALREE